MSDTQNQWIPVSERLPDDLKEKLVRTTDQVFRLAYVLNGKWRDPDVQEDLDCVTHWMDLPKPPAPPKPADPFEAWLDKQLFRDTHLDKACFYTPDHKVLGVNTAKWVWNAAKEHYAKPLPDFETWWDWQDKGDLNHRWREIRGIAINYPTAQAIWNAAQGKPEA